jgi:DNA-binding response OmpR family regulator
MRILVVEDDALVADAIHRAITAGGFVVDHVTTAEAAEATLRTDSFDLAVIDIGLPGADGFALVRRVRRHGLTLPILMLTARDEVADRVTALDLGADDYLVKPFAVPELAARCRALIRRVRSATSSEVNVGRLRLDLAHREAWIDEARIELTRREWSVLECLALEAGRLVSKEKLLGAISGWEDTLTPNALEVYISRLRGKLADAASIRVVRGLGYRLDDPAR